MEIFKNNNMANNSVQKITAAIICANMLIFGMPASVIATEISGVTPTGNVYNIEGDKFSGSTQFRQYDKFNLSQGDIANLIYKNGYDKFVNLVDNQVVINGIVNTMRNNNFYNGHAIFVSPNGMVIGASGILNVGSLTMMAPSQNAYKNFLNNYANNLSDYEFDLTKENYKSLITNSSGDIIINGQIYARNDVNAYGRRILTNVNPEDILSSANASPKIVAGIQDKDNVITKADEAEALFNSLVLNDTKDAESLVLKDGKIALITNKANEEILTKESVTDSANITTTINTTTGLKTVKTQNNSSDSGSENDNSDNNAETAYSIDKTYSKSSLSGNESLISINDATIVANDIELEANANSVKEVNEDTIKSYNDALNASQNNSNNNTPDDDSKKDETTNLIIHKSFNGVSPEAKASVKISNSKIIGDEVNIKANASSETETYIQLLDTVYDKWVGIELQKLFIKFLRGEIITLPSWLTEAMEKGEKYAGIPLNTMYENVKAMPKEAVDAIYKQNPAGEFFSEDVYTYFDGARAASNIEIINSEITGKSSVNITSNANAVTKISTGELDSLPMFLYGFGAKTDSNINVSGSKILTTDEKSTVDINALSTIENELNYDSSNFLAISEKSNKETAPETASDNIKKQIADDLNKKTEDANKEDEKKEQGYSNSGGIYSSDTDSDKSKSAEDNDKSDNNKTSDDNIQSDSTSDKEGADSQDSSDDNDKEGSGDNDKDDSTDSDKDKDKDEGGTQNTVSAYNIALLNNSIISDTGVNIENSEIEASNVNVRAVSFNKSETEVKNVSYVGKDSEHTGIAAGMTINHTKTNSNVNVVGSKITTKYANADIETKKDENGNAVKDDDGNEVKEVKSTYGNARFVAQNINQISNSVETEVKAKDQSSKYESKSITDYDKSTGAAIYSWLNKKLLSKVQDKMSATLDKLNLEMSGSAVWNNENNTASSVIGNSIINATTVDVSSNIIDFTTNSVAAEAGASNKFSAGAAVIVNDQKNTSTAEIKDGAKITATDSVKVNSTTQLPMNPMELKIGREVGEGSTAKELSLGVNFDAGDNLWDAEFLHTELKDLLNPDTIKNVGASLKKPKEFFGETELSLEGLFNNLAKAEGAGTTAAIAGSVVVNSIVNNTTAVIDKNAQVTMTGDIKGLDGKGHDLEGNLITRELNVNAANSVINYNGAGKVDFLIEEINSYIAKLKDKNDKTEDEAEEAAKVGLGGSVMVNHFTNNATAKIDNAIINIEDGDLNVQSAQEEAYVNALVTGGSAGTFVLEGSVNVQNVDGKTQSYIVNSDKISATNVNVNAGKATIQTKKSGKDDPIEIDEDTNELSTNDERDVKDRLININILGVNATQKGTSENSNQQSSSGASVGVSVNVTNTTKEVNAYIDNSTINAEEEVNVNADTQSRKVDVLLAAASAGGVDMKEAKEQAKEEKEAKEQAKEDKDNKDEPKDKDKDKDSQSSEKPSDSENTPESDSSNTNTKKQKNVGNWMDMLDEAGDDEEDVMNLNDLFKENDASEQAQTSVKKESTTSAIKTADKTVDKDGKQQDAKNENAKEGDKSNTDALTGNKDSKLEGDSNEKADTKTASSNFSLAAAGSIDITADKTKTNAKVTNSTINTGKKAEVSSGNDTLVVDVNGGFAKAGNVAVGAGVNIYRNLSETKSLVENSTVNFTDKDAEGLDVKSNFDSDLVDVTAGIGAATGSDNKAKIGVGGSFGWNTLKNKVSSVINKSTVNREENAGNPDVNVSATDDSYIWNITGGVAYAGTSKDNNNASENEKNNATGVGAGIAASVDYSAKDVKAEITDSTLTDVKDVKVNADLKQDFHTVAIAAAVANTDSSAYTFDGAVNTEVNTNMVTARVGQGYTYDDKGNVVKDKDGNIVKTGIGTTIKSTGDVEVNAVETVRNLSIAGGLNASTSNSGVGVGIGAVVNVNNSDVTAETDKATIEHSKSININAKEDEDLTFVAVNFGFQKGSGHSINVNGVANVFLSDVVAQAINNSVLKAEEDVAIQSKYFNNLWGVTAAVAVSKDGAAASANLIADVYNNHVTSLLEKGSTIDANGDVTVKSIAVEEMTIFPIGVSVSGNSAAVAANINANVIVDTITAQVLGEIVNSGSVLVKAQDTTSILTRGGTLALTFGDAAIGGDVNVDVINKNVTAEIKDTTVNSTGKVEVLAKSINSMGGTIHEDENEKDKDIRRENYTFSVGTLDDAKHFTDKTGEEDAKDDEGNIIYEDGKPKKLAKYDNEDKFKDWNMFYDLGVSSKAAVSGVIVVKVIDDTVKAYVTDSNINANSLNVDAISGTVANAIMGRINVGGSAAVGANIFVMSGTSTVEAQITDDYYSNGKNNINIANDTTVQANAEKKSTLITVGGAAAGTASVNGAAVANVINDTVTSKIGDGVNVNTGSLNVAADSDNDLKGLVVNVGAAGTAAVGAVVYVNKQNTTNTAQIGELGKSPAIIKAINDISVKANADDEFSALLVNVSASGTASVAGTALVNVIDSTVNSRIYNSNIVSEQGKVDVIADRGYNRDDILNENKIRSWFKNTNAYSKQYDKNKSQEDNKSEGIDIKKDITENSNFKPKVGIISAAGSGVAAVTATVVVNDMEGHIKSEVKDSEVSTKDGLNLGANQTFANYDAVAAVSAAGNAAVNATGVINVLEDDVVAQLDNTKVTKGGANVDSTSQMKLNQLVISGQIAATGASVGVSVDVNKLNDNVYAYVTNGSEIKDGTSVNAEHAVEINNVLLSASGAGVGAAIGVVPVVNKYTGTTTAEINGNSIVNDGAVTINAFDNIDNFSAIAGLSIAGVGASVNGYVITNVYDNTVNAGIKGLNLNTQNDINISSASVVDSENALLSFSAVGTGAGVNANVIVNDVESHINSYIEDSIVKQAGKITLTANKKKDGTLYQDKIHNLTGSAGLGGIGAAVVTNMIFNIYNNTTQSYVQNTDIEHADSLTVEAHGDKKFTENNYGATAAAIGAAVVVDAVVDQVESTTHAYIKANNNKNVNIDGAINVIADDRVISASDMGFVAFAGVGGAAGANVNVSNYNEAVVSEILTEGNSKVTAGSINLTSNAIYALKNTITGAAGGFGAIAGDVSVIQLGKREVLDTKERNDSGINKSLDTVKKGYDDAVSIDLRNKQKEEENNPGTKVVTAEDIAKADKEKNKLNLASSSSDGTGAITRINGNVETKGDITLNAKTGLKGIKEIDKDGNVTLSDTLTFDNTNLLVGVAAAGVGVKLIDFSNQTNAEIAGGTVKADGNININSESTNDVKITNNEFTAAGGRIGGAVGIYDNKSYTNAKIENSDVTANNVNINAKSSNKADVLSQSKTVAGLSASVAIAKTKDDSTTNAIITGNTNITTKAVEGDDNSGKLNLHATGDSVLKTNLQSNTLAFVSTAYMNGETKANSKTNAIIKDVNGNINVAGLNFVSDSNGLSSTAISNATTVSGFSVDVNSTGSNMTATMQSGIDSQENGLVINNSGKTSIISGVSAKDNTKGADVSANAYIENHDFHLAGGGGVDAKAVNDVKVNSIMNSAEHNADSLEMIAKVNETAKADVSNTSGGLFDISVTKLTADAKGNVGVSVAGKNTIKNKAKIDVNSNVTSDTSVASASYGFATGSGTHLTSNLESNTILNVGGELNAKEVEINSNTNRMSKVDYSSSQGGAVSIGAATVKNDASGKSEVNLVNYTSSTDYDNIITINNSSTNIQDTVSSSISGGAVTADSTSISGVLNSITYTNIKDSDIKTANDININVNNTNVVNDSATAKTYGIIAITSNDVSHTYSSCSEINIINSELSSSKNINLTANSGVSNGFTVASDGYVHYSGQSGAFDAKELVSVNNTLNENNSINLQNSTVKAEDTVTIAMKGNSNFNQQVGGEARGFAGSAHNLSTLTLNNNNTLNIDADSTVSSVNKTRIDLDSNNTLSTRAESDSYSFGGRDAEAHSNLYTTITNEINNSGSIESDNLVDINFMNNSENNLNQYTYTAAHAVIPTTTNVGTLRKIVNNAVNILSGAKIASKKDVDIDYRASGPIENLSSVLENIHQYYIAFGYTTNTKSENKYSDHNPSLKLDGDIIAGQGNNRYMKISSDGKIDFQKGFSSQEYILSDGDPADGEALQNNTVKFLENKISELNKRIEELENNIDKGNVIISEISSLISDANAMLDEINSLDLKTEDEFNALILDYYKNTVKQALIDNGDVDSSGNVSLDYETIINAYAAYIVGLDTQPNADTPVVLPTITEFLNSHDTYKNLTEAQKLIFQNNFNAVKDKISYTPKGEFTIFDEKYMLTQNITIKDDSLPSGEITLNEKDMLNLIIYAFQEYMAECTQNKEDSIRVKDSLARQKNILNENLDMIDIKEYDNTYSVLFGDIISETSGINISGMSENNIKGSGNFNVESSALTVDNYSTRSLIFNTINFGTEDEVNGLVINGKGYSDYLNNDNMLIGSETGVKYISNGIGGNGDIKITNYYDILNPFASTLDIPNNIKKSDITVQGPISTSGKLDIYNESGDIKLLADLNSSRKHLVSVNGDIQIIADEKFSMKDNNDTLFAGNSLIINANEANIKGNLSAGYKERKLVITDNMLENLVLDPTTGETNMIDLGATPYLGDANGNNIKAIYKDGQIYLFGIKDSLGDVKMDFRAGTVTAHVSTKEGASAINIINNTDKVLNVSNIVNVSSSGKLYKEGSANYSGINHDPWNLGIDSNTANIQSNGGINFNSAIVNSGDINISNKNGDITIFKDINAYSGNINVSQANGNILNGVIDDTISNHISANYADDTELTVKGIYVPHFSTLQDLVINVVDGDIGVNSNPNAKVGIDATTRDYTDTINVNVGGTVTATATNSAKTDTRLINIRAKDSNLRVKNITSDGDVILTAADWNVEDKRPTPNDAAYFEGYSILNASDNDSPIKGQNISLIASDTIGSPDKKIVISQDTQASNGSKISMEAENNMYFELKSNSNDPIYIDTLISKRGDIDFTNLTNATINNIISGGNVNIVETGKELTIYNIGGSAVEFDDILYPHDNIAMSGENAAAPESISIKVLDANGGNNAESTLKIYSAYVKGKNKGEGAFDENGRQIADVSLMADNIYINSANAKTSAVATKKNPLGYTPTNNTYTDAQLGINGDSVYQAQGLNSSGLGKPIVLDIKGVSKEFVDENVTSATRTNYNVQTPISQDPKFANPNNQITDYDYRANNVAISINNNNSQDRGVVLNSIYADDAYIDTKNSNLSVKDAYIKNYAEFSNADKKMTVDNNFRRRLRDADIQLFTAKTGSFSLGLDSSIDMKTTAPIVGNDFDKLANDYQSEGNFVNRSRKDSKDLTDSVDKYKQLEKQNYQEKYKRSSLRFNTVNDKSLKSNYKIYDLSTTGALVKNDVNLKVGDITHVRIIFDDIDVSIKSKVISVSGKRAGLEFIDMPKDVANKILYRYMQIADSMKQNSMTSSL